MPTPAALYKSQSSLKLAHVNARSDHTPINAHNCLYMGSDTPYIQQELLQSANGRKRERNLIDWEMEVSMRK